MIQEIKVHREQRICIARLHHVKLYNKIQKQSGTPRRPEIKFLA
jgi:hypothetical protein